MHLPEAYRSLSRPSSPVDTKASTPCPSKLDPSLLKNVRKIFSARQVRGFSSLLCSLFVTRQHLLSEARRAAIVWIFEYLPRTARSAQFRDGLFTRPSVQSSRSQEKLSFLHVDVKERQSPHDTVLLVFQMKRNGPTSLLRATKGTFHRR